MNMLDQNISSLETTVPELKQIRLLLEKMKQQMLTKDEYKQLQFLLINQEGWFRFNEPFPYTYPVCKTSITGDKIMFISDTHFGNNTNPILVFKAYSYALQQNIKTVIHVGDLIEGLSYYSNKNYDTILNELKTALNWMPEKITTKILLGNHDYSVIHKYPEMVKSFFNYPKLDILGMNKVILNWDDEANICISHPIYQLKSSTIKEDEGIIKIEGHHHLYQFKEQESEIHLPPLSCETLSSIEINSYIHPLFLIASKQGEYNILFEMYRVDNNLNIINEPLKVIEINTQTKKLKLHK